jgi:XTP/dITP diphosphohydrolase
MPNLINFRLSYLAPLTIIDGPTSGEKLLIFGIWQHRNSLISMNIVVMSNNANKIKEIQQMLGSGEGSDGYHVQSYSEVLNKSIVIVEDGLTFEENAIKKVNGMPYFKGEDAAIVVADDSGLEVMALDNQPGIHSARYGGEGLTDSQRCQVLLTELAGHTNRQARFVCVIACRLPNGKIETVKGIVTGHIATLLSGTQGFGYDPIFIPTGYTDSFSCLGQAIKSQISHRAQALQQVVVFLKKLSHNTNPNWRDGGVVNRSRL